MWISGNKLGTLWPIWIKVKTSWQILLQHQSTYLRGPESRVNLHQFQAKNYIEKVRLNVNIVMQDLLYRRQFLNILLSEVWKGRILIDPPYPFLKTHLCCIPIQAILSCIVRSVSFPFFLEKLQKSNIHTSSSKLNNSSLRDQACYVL